MCFTVNGEMQLTPDTAAFLAMLFDFLNHQMRDFTPGERLKLTLTDFARLLTLV